VQTDVFQRKDAKAQRTQRFLLFFQSAGWISPDEAKRTKFDLTRQIHQE
jgi:hypothetical protein